MNRFFPTFAALCALTSSVHAAPSAPDLLRAMQGAEATVQYSGVQTLTQQGAPTIVVRVWRSGARQRWEFVAPQVMKGDLLIDNGQIVKRYLKAENAVFETRSAPRRAARSEFAGQNATLVGEAKVAGRAAYVLSVSPRKARRAAHKVWIDKETKARLRIERFDAKGKTIESIGLQKAVFAPVPAAQFEWTAPANAQVTRTQGTLYARLNAAQRAANWLQVPRVLPSGFAFESAVVDSSGEGEAWLRYTNGAARFSIFQQRSAGDDTPPKLVDGSWFLRRNGSRFLVVGAPPDEAQRVAQSIR